MARSREGLYDLLWGFLDRIGRSQDTHDATVCTNIAKIAPVPDTFSAVFHAFTYCTLHYDHENPAAQNLRVLQERLACSHKAVLNGALADRSPSRTEGTSLEL